MDELEELRLQRLRGRHALADAGNGYLKIGRDAVQSLGIVERNADQLIARCASQAATANVARPGRLAARVIMVNRYLPVFVRPKRIATEIARAGLSIPECREKDVPVSPVSPRLLLRANLFGAGGVLLALLGEYLFPVREIPLTLLHRVIGGTLASPNSLSILLLPLTLAFALLFLVNRHTSIVVGGKHGQ